MKKIFASKKFMSKIALILVCLTLFQFIAPQPTRAENGEIGGTLLKPIVSLFLSLSDGVTSIIQNTLFKKTGEYTEEINMWVCKTCGAEGGKKSIEHKEGCTKKDVAKLMICEDCKAKGPKGEIQHSDKCGHPKGAKTKQVTEIKTITETASVDAFEYIDLTGNLSTGWKRLFVFLGGILLLAGGALLTTVTGGAFAGCLVLIGKVVLASGVLVAITSFLPNVAEIWEVVFGDSFTYVNILVTPEALFKNQIGLFDANFFRDANTTTTLDITSEVATTLRELISNVYSVVRNISIMAMLIVIVYMAIRMLISLSPREKSRYKEGFVNCIIGLIIILGMHYAMSISNTVIDNITNSITIGDMGYKEETAYDEEADGNEETTYDEETVKENIEGASIKISGTNIYKAFVENGEVKEAYEGKVKIDDNEEETIIIAANNFQEIARYKAQQIYETDSEGDNKKADWNYIGWAFVYVMLTILTLAFVWMYGKRLLYLAVLTMFAPIVGVMYPINRADGSRAHTLNLWFKEYFGNLIIQPFHMFFYSIVIGGAMATAVANPIYVIIALTGVIFTEKIMKDLLGIQDTRIGGLGKSLQETNRAIKTATRETARAARAAKRGVEKGVRAGVGLAQKAGGRRAGDADSSEEDANTNLRLGGANAGNEMQPTRPDGTDALEAPQPALEAPDKTKTPQQRMLDAYDEGFGTNEWDAQERDALAKEAYPDEAEKNARETRDGYANMPDEELAQELRNLGYEEEDIPQAMSEIRQAYNEEEQKQEMLDSNDAELENNETDNNNTLTQRIYAEENAKKTRERYEKMSDQELSQELKELGYAEEDIPQIMSDMRQTWNAEEQKREMIDSNNSGFDEESLTPQLQNGENVFNDTAEETLETLSTNGLDNSRNLEIPSSTNSLDMEENTIEDGSQGISITQGMDFETSKPEFLQDDIWEDAQTFITKSGNEVKVIDTPNGQVIKPNFSRENTQPLGTMAMAAGDDVSMNVGNNIKTVGNTKSSDYGDMSLGGSSSVDSSIRSVSSGNTRSSNYGNMEIDNTLSRGTSINSVSSRNASAPDYRTSNDGMSAEIVNFKEQIAKEKQLTEQAKQTENTARTHAKQTQRSIEQISTGSSNTQSIEIAGTTSSRETASSRRVASSGGTVQNVSTRGSSSSSTSNRQTSSRAQNNSNIDASIMQQLEQELADARRKREIAQARENEAVQDTNAKSKKANKIETVSAVANTIGNVAGKTTGIAGRVLEGTISAAADAMAGNPTGVVQDAIGVVRGSTEEIRADRGSSKRVSGMAQLNNEAQYLVKEGHTEERAKYVEVLCGKLKDKGIVIDDRRDMEAVARAIKATGDKGDKTINSLIGTAKQFKINGRSREDYERAVESKGVSSSAKDALLKLFDNLKA